MVQMDLQKAYDSVEWSALEGIMREMGFPGGFVEWIMICVRTVSYRFSVNGGVTDILKAKRGLRQGDPISPFLSVIVMEYLHRCLQKLKLNPNFNFHPKCEKLGTNNICFAGDLLMYARGDLGSMLLLMGAFTSFSNATGLVANVSESKVYFGGVHPVAQQQSLWKPNFLTVVYLLSILGVPLDSKKLTIENCAPLIEKITGRLRHWTTKLLSYAGRLQLIKSVLFGISLYWLQIFPLPKKVFKHIEGLCRSFMWSGTDVI